jgi:hypothetical protein
MALLWQTMAMRRWYPFAAMLGLLIAFRLVGAWQGWMNVSPLPALFLLSMACSSGRDRWLLPLSAWVISDPLLNVFYGQSFWAWDQLGMVIGCLAIMWVASWVRNAFSVSRALLGSTVAAILFYFVTNTVSFFSLTELYDRTWQGFWQAQWSGPVGLGPTWVFLRNALVANLLFSSLFLLALRPLSAYFRTPLSSAPAR